MGQLYLTNVDFLKNGVPASIVAAAVIFFWLSMRIPLTNRVDCRHTRLCLDDSDRVRITFWPLVSLWHLILFSRL